MTDDPDPTERLAVDVAEPSLLWREHLPEADAISAAAARAALAAETTPAEPTELSIVLGNDEMLRGLNRQWRGQDKPTNVLSFPALDATPAPLGAPRLLGDVVLAFETVAAEAAAQGKPLADHLRHLVVHGVLHLLGYDHEADADAQRMEASEIAILAGLGVPDPYRVREASRG